MLGKLRPPTEACVCARRPLQAPPPPTSCTSTCPPSRRCSTSTHRVRPAAGPAWRLVSAPWIWLGSPGEQGKDLGFTQWAPLSGLHSVGSTQFLARSICCPHMHRACAARPRRRDPGRGGGPHPALPAGAQGHYPLHCHHAHRRRRRGRGRAVCGAGQRRGGGGGAAGAGGARLGARVCVCVLGGGCTGARRTTAAP